MIVGTKVATREYNVVGQTRLLHGIGDPVPAYGKADFAKEIIYLQMQVSVSPDLQFSYQYLSGSGVLVPDDEGIIKDADLDDYVQDLQAGAYAGLLDPVHNTLNAAPNIVTVQPCYIVMELFASPTLIFEPGYPGIKVEHANDYDTLYYYDTSLTRTPRNPAAGEPCYIVCFGLKTDLAATRTDQYSILLQFAQASGNTIDAEVDPHIKNRG